MEESIKSNNSLHASDVHSPHQKGFQKAISLLGIMITGGILLENIQTWFFRLDQPMAGAALAIVGLVALLGLAFYKPFYRIIDNPPFAISCLLALAFATALGTFVTQNVSPEAMTERYGETRSKIFQFLQLDDVFHSWWYVGFYVLLSVSLVKISLKKKFGWENLGFHLAHLSPIVILIGFWVDYFYGFKGIIKLEEGQSKNIVQRYDASQKFILDSIALDFSIRLDDFEFERYEPDYRFQIWRQDTTGHPQPVGHGAGMVNEKPPQIIASLPVAPMEIHHIYGTDLYFRMTKLYPNFEFKYTYPEVIDTIEAKDPGIQMDIKMPDGNALLQLRSETSGKNKLLDETTFGAWLEFYWDLPQDVSSTLAAPAKSETNRIIFAGADRRVHFLFNGELKTEALELKRYYSIPGKDSTGFTIEILFPDAAYLSAEPSTKDDRMENPLAMMEIWHKGQTAQEAYLYPAQPGRRAGTYQIPGTPYFLALESIKDQETKYYKSDLAVLDGSGVEVKKQTIKVNEPMNYNGYRFYQTDYDPRNPRYSGIGVTHNPGLLVIYFGFYVMVAGVGLMFYGKNARKNDSTH